MLESRLLFALARRVALLRPATERDADRGKRDCGRHGIEPDLRTVIRRNTALSKEIATLRLVFAQMQEELHDTRAREASARHIALHDELTMLPNRRYFREHLQRALAPEGSRPGPVAIFFLDLDEFKMLNDVHGHATGDELLRIVGARLAHAVRAADVVCRLGGDEYACLITGVATREQLRHLAATLFHAVAAPIQLGLSTVSVQSSIGIAIYPADGSTAEALLDSADRAMYAAKRERLGCAFATDAYTTRCHPA